MKQKTFFWQAIFSIIFLGLIIKASFNTELFFEVSLLAAFSLAILSLSKRRDDLILIHNSINLLLITLVFLAGIKGVDITLAFLITILGLILTSISIELNEQAEKLNKLNYYIEKSKSEENKPRNSEKKAVNEKPSKETKTEAKPKNSEKKTAKQVRYVAGKFSHQYHVEDCPVAKRLVKKRYYESKEKAEFAGLKPHDCVK
ncbi:MAG: hypothetical protein PWP03_258 [Candidatus Woesearchaeota archaeon]|nr:hypothetical protein [Candidatus Woesearchaeota archaeon]MDN5327620.1 hypothetical protein [Candidatus Woesearchaeota archaeon]